MYSGNTLNQCCWKKSSPGPPPDPPEKSYLLDDYPGAYGAYSLRKLSTTAFTDNCVRVRRSDTMEADIGWDPITDTIDTATLIIFAAGQACFVTTWYDQSNGPWADLFQTALTLQPQILGVGGVLYEWNGHPYINEVSTKVLSTIQNISGVPVYTTFSTANIPQGVGGTMPGFTASEGWTWRDGLYAQYASKFFRLYNNPAGNLLQGTIQYTEDQFNLATGVFGAGNVCRLFTNGVVDGTVLRIETYPPVWQLTAYSFAPQNEPDWVEFIFYPFDMSTAYSPALLDARVEIDQNITDYYGI